MPRSGGGLIVQKKAPLVGPFAWVRGELISVLLAS